MRSTVSLLGLAIAMAAGGCASNLPENPLAGPPPPELEIVREAAGNPNPEVGYLRIEGMWLNLRTGFQGADFELRDVAIVGERFTGVFKFGSGHRLECAFEASVTGTVRDQVLRFEVPMVCGTASFQGNINTANWRGFYTSGLRGHGWLLVKRVTLPSS